MTDTYRMTVDLNVLDHLGINLYSNVAAVLTEVVANAWDADAETVVIRIDPKQEWIEIVDDGVGMTVRRDEREVSSRRLPSPPRRQDARQVHGEASQSHGA